MISGCAAEPDAEPDADVVQLHYDFSDGDEGFHADIADFLVNQDVEFVAGVRELAPELERPGTGFYLQSNNHSDTAFMFIYRGIGASDGVAPDARYTARYTLTMASDAQAGCAGIGGAPAEAVYLKVGAAGHEPAVVIEPNGGVPIHRVNVDKGEQVDGGADMSVAGDIANGITPCGAPFALHTFTRTHEHPTPVTASSDGALWLMIGTDSGFEGITRLFYQQIDVELTPAP